MARKWTNLNLPGALHYVTGNVIDKIKIFRQKRCWQEGFKAFPLYSGWMIWQKMNYIYNNPVRAKLARSAKDYKWSSFRAYYYDSQEPLPVHRDWWCQRMVRS